MIDLGNSSVAYCQDKRKRRHTLFIHIRGEHSREARRPKNSTIREDRTLVILSSNLTIELGAWLPE